MKINKVEKAIRDILVTTDDIRRYTIHAKGCYTKHKRSRCAKKCPSQFLVSCEEAILDACKDLKNHIKDIEGGL